MEQNNIYTMLLIEKVNMLTEMVAVIGTHAAMENGTIELFEEEMKKIEAEYTPKFEDYSTVIKQQFNTKVEMIDEEVKKEMYNVFYKDTGRKIEEISDEEMQAAYNSIAGAYMNLNMAIKKPFNDVRKAMQPILDIVKKYGEYK